MDTLLGWLFIIVGVLAVITVIWGALLLVRDHALLAVILLVAGGVPIIAGGWVYASFFPVDSNLNKLAWMVNIILIVSMILYFLFG